MHLEAREPDHEARTDEAGLFAAVAIAQHVADVLAQVALDALAELLDAIDVLLIHAMRAVGLARPRLELRDPLVLDVVPRHVGDEVLDHRERLERLRRDRLGLRERVHARHARELRLAVDLHRARAALAGLAVPAQREIVRLVALDPVQHVEHDHARVDVDLERLELAASGIAAPDFERSLGHRYSDPPTLPDSRSSILAFAIATKFAGPSGFARFSISISPFAPRLMMTLYLTHSALSPG